MASTMAQEKGGDSVNIRLLSPIEASRCLKLGMDEAEQIDSMLIAQDAKTRAATLKEVGEWLNEHASCGKHSDGLYSRITTEHLKSFFHGEIPTEGDAP